jgi:hypothetical protein
VEESDLEGDRVVTVNDKAMKSAVFEVTQNRKILGKIVKLKLAEDEWQNIPIL